MLLRLRWLSLTSDASPQSELDYAPDFPSEPFYEESRNFTGNPPFQPSDYFCPNEPDIVINQNDSPDTQPESSSQSGDNVVQGHLVTLKAKDGREKLFFLDPSGSLLPILPAEFTPAEMQVVKVSPMNLLTRGGFGIGNPRDPSSDAENPRIVRKYRSRKFQENIQKSRGSGLVLLPGS